MAMLSISRQSAAPFQDELRGVFALQAVDKNMRGMSFFIWPKRSSTLAFLASLGWVLGHDKVKELRTQPSANCLE